MNKAYLLLTLLFPFAATASDNVQHPENQPLIQKVNHSSNTYTYVKCWYRTSVSHDEPATDWVWAKNSDNSYYELPGYWWSSISFKNMFYTDVPNKAIAQRCATSIDTDNKNADIIFYASDIKASYSHTIWSNDNVNQPNTINRIVAFGDSLSDTSNTFNGSQWIFPNSNSWFLGHFSNGLVWTEYLANAKNLPLYNWAVGGAAGVNEYGILTGIYDQISSFNTYMKSAKNYHIENTLFTLEFGLNDFMNYDRNITEVKSDYSTALIRLTDAGAKNILLMTLPDASKAPQFKYATADKVTLVSQQIKQFNLFIKEQAAYYKQKGINITLVDAYQIFENVTSEPQKYGFVNAKDACMDINRSSSKDYLMSHTLTNDCAQHGSDKYVFWGVTHPTTAMHKYIARKIITTVSIN
ncbi:SGNH/GDSL hydrolase family protein [Photobacterium phosphoreum]|jgi:thermolabile hemolysin|uniref:SGNH/GDSL hydrolase family protein n=1 Tax=Photobacterium phosphoreum TaxID=659 RepID=UPI0007F8E14E|nr:SGNH/GDSL hydrolase family protein [Photobacterium phosphoreum]MCD9471027.1 thermolabile hemolysin [Photobacterium phosphoreum]MCD9501325.1 thermolabile hemolysin [Photobacterium phosphoreum]MCD9507423.1 thermolabile hemolysin [Photobacterium phosphoreum]MCD9520297.1 thermolabile hemolysin [Photobacterium phosphoreum]OBU34042.1 thermolabile hemolysin [Photobacterium phosphoreum]